MALNPGTKLGPYEILSPLGAGGMGEVYRAKDTRLDREVAIKVLPESTAKDPDALARFEREAKAVAALSHPNILSLLDVGKENDVVYAVMELLEGETLRAKLQGGALPPRKTQEYARQIAEGLAAAHEKGIIHRDLKPENLFVTSDGRVKILDFGLAKQTTAIVSQEAQDATPTRSVGTEPGMTLGTVGYMSPEQVRGEAADTRADIFSFGAVLYEMATGNRAFKGATAVDTMHAILNAEPPEAAGSGAGCTPALERIIQHCLEKAPMARFQSARDLAFDLQSLAAGSGLSGVTVAAPGMRFRRPWRLAAGLALLIAVAAAGAWAGLLSGRGQPAPPPLFHQLTYGQGIIRGARFSTDGQTILYSAQWNDQPSRVFIKRTEGAGSIPVELPGANLLAVTGSGGIAVQLAPTRVAVGATTGTLAEVPMTGGTPREILENVQQADWDPAGAALIVARYLPSHRTLEWPAGKSIYETNGHVSYPRLAPQGDWVAFFDHPEPQDDRGAVAVIDRAGKRRTLSDHWESLQGLAWSPDGSEIWFSAAHAGSAHDLYAVNRKGSLRLVSRTPGGVTLHDIARDGRILLTTDEWRNNLLLLPPGEATEREQSWLEGSVLSSLSSDGRILLFTETGSEMGRNYGVCLRKTDGSPPVRLGEGKGLALSPDGRWALSALPGEADHMTLLPTGTGVARTVQFSGLSSYLGGLFMPDGEHLLVVANEPGRRRRCFWGALEGGKARPVTPEGTGCGPVSPDGQWLAAPEFGQTPQLFPVAGGVGRPIAGITADDRIIRWSGDGKSLFLRSGILPVTVSRLELSSGRRQTVRKLMPADPAGVGGISAVRLTPDGAAYAYSFNRELSRLFLVEGLK